MSCQSSVRKANWIFVLILIASLTYTVSAASGSNPVNIVVRELGTKDYLNDAQVYLDGSYRGATVSGDRGGTLVIYDVSPGTHTVRVTRANYKEITKKFNYPAETTVEIMLSKGKLVYLDFHDPLPNAINVVFYPSSTSYNCENHEKVVTQLYTTNETRFRKDILKTINNTYLNLDQFTSASNPLPRGYRDHFNFYYYYDPSSPADAFSGCAGSIPESYWVDVPFSDVTVILYPTYYGIYADSSCQPTGCYQNLGPGRNLMKAPADQVILFKHETGHAVFDLIDTYCGTTYYNENYPYPNVWASLDACRVNAQSNNRNPEQCLQIEKKNSSFTSCIKNYWRWDPMPDIMANGYSGRFGDAATQRINYVLSQSGAD